MRRRVVSSIVSFIGVVVATFVLARLTGNPANLYLPIDASTEMREAFAATHGFDRPLLVQFGSYVADVFQGDLGESLRTGQSALAMVLSALATTLKLGAVTLSIALVIALVVGSLAALRPNSLPDRVASTVTVGAASIPDFWFAIMMILILAVQFGLVPTSGTPQTHGLVAWVLPVATLLLRPLGILTQVVRGAMIEVLSSNYMTFAAAKGYGTARLLFVHGLRNAMIPVTTVAGDLAIGLVNGAIIVEVVFGWPGVGKLMVDAVLQRDFPVLQAAVIVTAAVIFVSNLIVDAIGVRLDPTRQLVAA